MSTSNDKSLYRWIVYDKSDEKTWPKKFGMYVTIVKILDEGLTFYPTSYNQFDTIRNEWTNQSVGYHNGEITEWLCKVEVDQQALWENVSIAYAVDISGILTGIKTTPNCTQDLQSKYTLIPKQ